MHKLLTLILLVAFLASPSAALADDALSPCVLPNDVDVTASPEPLPGQDDWADAVDDPLAGRLGASDEGWTVFYAGMTDSNGMLDWKGCGPLTGYQVFKEGEWPVVNINLYADRAADIENGTLANPSEANWTQDEALFIAHRLLPKDAKLVEQTTTDVGNIKFTGHSIQLAEQMPQEAMDFVGATGTPGDLQVVLYLSSDGTVYAIDIQVGGYGEK